MILQHLYSQHTGKSAHTWDKLYILHRRLIFFRRLCNDDGNVLDRISISGEKLPNTVKKADRNFSNKVRALSGK